MWSLLQQAANEPLAQLPQSQTGPVEIGDLPLDHADQAQLKMEENNRNN